MGDVAETIALLLPPPEQSSDSPLSYWIEKRLLPLRGQSEEEQHAAMLQAWRELDQPPAVRLEQAHQRRVSRRRLAAACHAGTC